MGPSLVLDMMVRTLRSGTLGDRHGVKAATSVFPRAAATHTAHSLDAQIMPIPWTPKSCVTASTSGLESALNQQPVSVTVRADNSWQSYRSGTVRVSKSGLFLCTELFATAWI